MEGTTIAQIDIDNAKGKYGEQNVKIATLPLDDDGNNFRDVLMKKPGRKAISQYQMWADKNADKANEILVNDCLILEKDKTEIKADQGGLFMAALDAAAQLIPVRKAVIKNC